MPQATSYPFMNVSLWWWLVVFLLCLILTVKFLTKSKVVQRREIQ